MEHSCDCRWMRRAVAEPMFPIRFDPELNEYHLMLDDGERQGCSILHYCPYCGGKLPASRRRDLFTEPSETDRKDVEMKMKAITSVDDLFGILGQPDHEMEAEPVKPEQIWKRQFTYCKWDTLQLFVTELEDGRLTFAFCGKYRKTAAS